jgi:hypothetical protein
MLEEKLNTMDSCSETILQVFRANKAVYIVVNISVGSVSHKSLLMKRPKIIESILSLMVSKVLTRRMEMITLELVLSGRL